MTAILSNDTNRDEWLAERRKGIGASEIAAVLGISPWESPFSLYWRKVNGWDADLDPEMEWGQRLEPAIAGKYEDEHTDHHLINPGLCFGDEPWMMATPDRLICMNITRTRAHAVGLLELKYAVRPDSWGEPGTSEIPVYYRAQVQWQMLVTGLQWATVAVLIGGSDYREYQVLRDEKDLRVMVEAGRRFMARIEAGDPPPLDDHTATLTTVKRLHPDLDDTTAEISPDVAAGYARAVRWSRLAKSVKARYEALLRDQMGRARKATSAGTFVASRSLYDVAEHPVKGHTVDRLNPARGSKK